MKRLLIVVALAGAVVAGCGKSSLTPEECVSKAEELVKGVDLRDKADVQKKIPEAIEYYESAADRGSAKAIQNLLGIYAMFEDVGVVFKDEATYLAGVKKALHYKIDWSRKNNKIQAAIDFEGILNAIEKKGMKGAEALSSKWVDATVSGKDLDAEDEVSTKDIPVAFMVSLLNGRTEWALSYCADANDAKVKAAAERIAKRSFTNISCKFIGVEDGESLDDAKLTEANVFLKCSYATDGHTSKRTLSVRLKRVKGEWKVCSFKEGEQNAESRILPKDEQLVRSMKVFIAAIYQTGLDHSDEWFAWPRSEETRKKNAKDISGKVFSTSAEYFKEVLDAEHYGTSDWCPCVCFGLNVIAGAGVPVAEGGKLTGNNVAWYIAKGITEKVSGCVPVLISRNVCIDQFPTQAGRHDMSANKTQVKLGKANGADSDLPLGKEAFVIVTADGSVKVIRPGQGDTLNAIYDNQTIELPKGFGYLRTGCSN